MDTEKVTLGIDLGSTSTRAVLGPHYVEETNRAVQSLRFAPGDFSSAIYPFEADGPTYLYEESDPTRRPVSAKYAFYALVVASDELLEQYPLVDELVAGRDDRAFQQRLRRGLEALFIRIGRLTRAICDENDYEIDVIGLSIPSQWTMDFEDLYRAIVVSAFGAKYKDRVVFVYETEALGHYLCTHACPARDYAKKLLQSAVKGGQEKTVCHDVLLFIDFGGHNANTCTFNVVYEEKNKPSFYLVSSAKGAGGGSEQWEYSIVQTAVQMLEEDRGRRLPSSIKGKIFDDFNKSKRNLGPACTRKWYTFEGLDESRDAIAVPFSPETIERHFDAAMKRPLDLARERIEELREIAPPLFTDEWNMNYDSMKIARGTAYAAGNRITVEQFFERGAAIGVQRQQRGTRGNYNEKGYWDDEAVFALSKDRRVVWQDFSTGRDRLKLVCHPFYERQTPPKKLEYFRCYDLLGLGMPTRGHWDIALSLAGRGDDVRLVMERAHAYPRKKGLLPPPAPFDAREFPLYYNRGENCIHVGREGQEDDEATLEAVTVYKKKEKVRVEKGARPRARKVGKTVRKSRGAPVSKARRRGRRAAEGGNEGRNSTAGAQTEATTATLPKDPVEIYMQKTSVEMISHEEEIELQFRRAIKQNPHCDSSTISTIPTPIPSESPPNFPVGQDTDRISATALSTTAYSCSAGNRGT
ncbi:hypothetical protein PG991_000897 [Apiospora marii]|uniref:Actin-like ATPase domain-containing protein n=1 Tax=Apiospora marii TaxID=335849 RepID=A0ABR1SUM8_9PEZI